MLNQMIESRNHTHESKTKSALLIGIGVLILVLFAGGLLTSLFAQQIGVTGVGLELSTLVAPVPIPVDVPPVQEEEPRNKQMTKNSNVDVRKVIVANIKESPTKPPDRVSTIRNTIPERRIGRLTLRGDTNQNAQSSPIGNVARSTSKTGTRIGSASPGILETRKPNEAKKFVKAPPKLKKKPAEQTRRVRISGKIINGRAKILPKPVYSAQARLLKLKGKVEVSVVISTSGKVISAVAKSGHPLLKPAAVNAARRAVFSPTVLSGQSVEVTGTIIYNFN